MNTSLSSIYLSFKITLRLLLSIGTFLTCIAQCWESQGRSCADTWFLSLSSYLFFSTLSWSPQALSCVPSTHRVFQAVSVSSSCFFKLTCIHYLMSIFTRCVHCNLYSYMIPLTISVMSWKGLDKNLFCFIVETKRILRPMQNEAENKIWAIPGWKDVNN
jgi:hypothetical protein